MEQEHYKLNGDQSKIQQKNKEHPQTNIAESYISSINGLYCNKMLHIKMHLKMSLNIQSDSNHYFTTHLKKTI